ncbi:uncharacterized protein LOC124935067 [Impatiens glandulifera]|uniref:uncharacterized protein LOC124935067 n=1 Tax=Impatiens glandulifera TaxID=253017 RepID=UPI001FB0B7D2|nr:uncharacterized protein LOC124935067 [Impatiens glandulifera]
MEFPQNVKEAQLWLLSDILQEEPFYNKRPAPFTDIESLLDQRQKRNVAVSPMNTRPLVPPQPQGFGYPVRQDLMTNNRPSSFTIPSRPEAPYSHQNRVQFPVPIGGYNEHLFRAPVNLKESGAGAGRKSGGTGVFIPTARGKTSARNRPIYKVIKDDATK